MCFMEDKDDLNKQYGEMIPTGFKWVGLDDQKKRAEELNNMTKNKK